MHDFHREYKTNVWVLLLLLILTACNLTSAPEQLDLTNVPTSTLLPTRTAISTGSAPTPITVTSLPIPTQIAQRPTAILPATFIPFPTPSPLPVNIAIFSPIPGSVVAGNVQVIGAATHPSFLQYQLEWGPDPNPGDLWFLAGGIVQNPVFNGLLGIWNTTSIQDGQYQLRLKVFLRDGTNLATVINGIRVQNQIPTVAPTATTIPRPIAAFSVDRSSGQAPLVVRFFNQSSGNITSYSWNFGDGGSSSEASPQHTFRNPGIYNVTFRVRGPGGESNVSRQITVQSASAPVAGFTQDRTSGPSPLTVQFTDQSQGNITQRLWSFGDGATSNAVNPSHQFAAVGTYNVILTVTGPGGSSSVTRQITVENPTIPEPIAALVPSQTEGEAPLTVQFDASDSSGQIDSYNWTFGDGTFGNGRIVTHTFSNPGLYEVALVVVGPGGQSQRRVEINVVRPPDAPVAAIEVNQTSGDIPLTVNFDATDSTGPVDTYTWDFGDQQTGQGATIQHIYQTAGTYTVVLTVDGPGGSDTETIEISALQPVQPPEAAFSSLPSEGIAPLQVQFTNLSTGEELSFEWNFGDSSPVSNERDPQHTFNNPGTYTVTLRVTGPGGSDEVQGTVNALEPTAPPSAAFDAFPTSGEAPLTVTFDSTGDPSRIASYQWDFGDGETSSTADPQHIYQQQGNYTARLTVTGQDGREATSEVQIAVSQAVVIAPPVAGFTVNPPSATVGQPVQFTNTTTGDAASFEWNFGDGTTSNEASPQHTFNNSGDFTVSLRAIGPGGENTTQQSYSVAQPAQPPVAGFTVNPPSATVGQPVQFTNTTTGDAASFEWNFGDGTTSNEASPQHTFNNSGDFTVSLRAIGPGGENTTQQSYSVAQPAQPPVAGFTVNPPSATVGQPVQFTNTTTGDAASFEWNFGDGTTSNEASPQHTFNSPGDFTVSLRAIGPGGENTTQQSYSVAQPAQPPQAAFSSLPSEGVAPLQVQFTNLSTGEGSIFEWNFGDSGPVSNERDPQHTFANPGIYTVTLRVTGPGGSDEAQGTVNVLAPAAPPPVAGFTVNPPSATVGQPVQFTNTTTGDAASFEWNFGDGTTSNEASPQHTFNNSGDFTVSLRAIGPGGENTTQQIYSVAAEVVDEGPGVVGEIPLLPDLEPQGVRNRLRAIFETGAAQGKRASVFTVIGDLMAVQSGYLDPFADTSLNTGEPNFQEIIDWYNQTDLGDGRTSFDHSSLAANSGWRAEDLLDPSRSDGANCNPGETPLDCELRVSQAAVAIISIGINDVSSTDPAAYQATMEQILRTVVNNGVIPIVTTIQPNPGSPNQVRAINDALIQAVRNVESGNNTYIPIYNLWRAYNELPNSGLEGDNVTPTIAPNGPGVISQDITGTYATNRRNRQTLNLLNRLHTQIFPDAAP